MNYDRPVDRKSVPGMVECNGTVDPGLWAISSVPMWLHRTSTLHCRRSRPLSYRISGPSRKESRKKYHVHHGVAEKAAPSQSRCKVRGDLCIYRAR